MEHFNWIGFLLVVLVSSTLSGMAGMAGGMVLLNALGLWFPPAVVIPLHGCLQSVSNGSRVVLWWRAVNWRLVATFASGAVGAAALGTLWLPALPASVTSWAIGLVCLGAVWLPLLKRAPADTKLMSPVLAGLLGLSTTFVSLFAGTTGPLVDAFLVRGQSKAAVLGTKAAFQFVNHSFKLVVFLVAGFSLVQWGPILLAALPFLIAGTKLGQLLVDRVPQTLFQTGLRWMVTLLALFTIARTF
jgi:uncharacterized membrane protein YfcA